MIRVAAITSSRDDPSSRFRMRQFFGPLRERGIEAVEYRPWISKYAGAPLQLTGLGVASRVFAAFAARQYDIAWLNRELVTGHQTLERFVGKRRLLDVDDAIWLKGRNGFAREIASHCDGVIAGNRRIADYFRNASPHVWIVPTAIDTDRWIPAATAPEPFTIGWSGTAWNLPYLYSIEDALARFLAEYPQTRMLIVCDRRPAFQKLPADRFEFLPWSAGNEVDVLQRMSVGLTPLPDDEWTRAKCATKMLCYMSVGLPVIVSPVGAAADILEQADAGIAARDSNDWYDALVLLYKNRGASRTMGRAGRVIIIERYSVRYAVEELAKIFAEVARR